MDNGGFDLGFNGDDFPRIVEEFSGAVGDFDAVLQRARQKVAADIDDVGKKLASVAERANGKISQEIAEVSADTLPIFEALLVAPIDDVIVAPDLPDVWLLLKDDNTGKCKAVRQSEFAPDKFPRHRIIFRSFDLREVLAELDRACVNDDVPPSDPETPDIPEDPTVEEPPQEPKKDPETCPETESDPCFDPDTECPKPPPEGLQYCVWKHPNGGDCLILPAGETPSDPNYVSQICFDSFKDATAWAAQNCQDFPDEPQTPPRPPADVWYCLFSNEEQRRCVVRTSTSPANCRMDEPGWRLRTWSKDPAVIEELQGVYCRFPGGDQPETPDTPQPPQPPTDPQQPPTDEPDDKGPGQISQRYIADYCKNEIWSDRKKFQDWIDTQFGIPRTDGTFPGVRESIKKALTDAVNTIVPLPFQSFTSELISDAIDNIMGSVEQTKFAVPTIEDCEDPASIFIAAVNMGAGIFAKYITDLPKKSIATFDYAENFTCPWLLPSIDQADAAFLTGVIDEETLTTLHKINGACTEPARAITESKRSRLTPLDIVALLRREKIDSTEARTKIRANGYLDPGALEEFLATTEFVPGPSDIIRFMQRDVSDAGVVEKFGLDDEFGSKFTGDTAKLAEFQGVPESYMKLYWRAHWDIPSPTQLYEFYRRLRNPAEIPVPADALALGVSPDPTTGPRTDPSVRIGEEDVKTALAQQDILPYWQDKFLATAYLPLTRVDARRAYEIGVVDVSEIYESLIQNGYSPENATILTKFAKRDKELKIPNQEAFKQYKDGLIPRFEAEREMIGLGYDPADFAPYFEKVDRSRLIAARSLDEFRLYADGSITEDELENELIERNYDTTEIVEVLNRARLEVRRRTRSACVNGYREQFLRGDLSKEDAKDRLRDLELNEQWIQDTVNGWDCILDSSDRLPRVRLVAEWLALGIINEDEADRQLERMRFSEDNRNRILAQIQILAQIKRDKEAERLRTKEAREVEKRRKAEAAAERRRQAAAEKTLRRAAKRQSDAERLAIALQKLSEKWASFTGLNIESASDQLQGHYGDILNEYPLTDKYALQALTRSVEWAIKEEERDLQTIIDIVTPEVVETADALL